MLKKLFMCVVIHLSLCGYHISQCGKINRSTNSASQGQKRTEHLFLSINMIKCLDVQYMTKFHWARNYPHSNENTESTCKNEEADSSGMVQLSLFYWVGYTNGSKLQMLLQESKCSAVLDIGYSRTVCGNSWLTGLFVLVIRI